MYRWLTARGVSVLPTSGQLLTKPATIDWFARHLHEIRRYDGIVDAVNPGAPAPCPAKVGQGLRCCVWDAFDDSAFCYSVGAVSDSIRDAIANAAEFKMRIHHISPVGRTP